MSKLSIDGLSLLSESYPWGHIQSLELGFVTKKDGPFDIYYILCSR